VDEGETGGQCLERADLIVLDIVQYLLDGFLRSEHAGQVDPLAQSEIGFGLEDGPQRFQIRELPAFEALEQAVAQEFVDPGLIEDDAPLERRLGDSHAVVGEVVAGRAGGLSELAEKVPAVDHLLDGKRAQQLEIDEVQLLRVFPPVALGPLAGVAHRSDAAQVHPRGQDALVLALNEIGKRQV